MSTRRWYPPRWKRSESGILVPSDPSSSVAISSSLTYLQIKEKALAIRSLYAERSVPLPANCGLAELINDAIESSDHWLLGSQEQISNDRLYGLAQMDRIAEAIKPIKQMSDCATYLQHMTGGSLEPFNRERSKSKDTLWELELLAVLKRRSFNAVLEEPPDIVVDLDGSRIGIACKKFYSTKHVQSVLSDGVSQIESAFDFGILAVNLDDLLAPQLITSPNQDVLGEQLNSINFGFLRSHERHFRKYLSTGRLLGALVSAGGIADVFHDNPRLQTARQSTMWVIPGLPPEKERVIRRIRDELMS